ncbi:hypothetical protein KJ652_01915 [Patescibacteria group bacterium]|nr:hypothetical protein [Patescibacteria group bacterium]MBU1123321.1 hypothetical protein [Patescibacteria group bacterium]MBU1911486.1 hypothetical protein [Patescibacteria group bacterium]
MLRTIEERDVVEHSMPEVPRRSWRKRIISDPLLHVGGVQKSSWNDFYRYCLENTDPCEPIFSVCGSDELTEEHPDNFPAVTELLRENSSRCLYAIMERGIDSDQMDVLQGEANDGEWSGKLEVFVSDGIQSHMAICGDHCFLEVPHGPFADEEDRLGVMITRDSLLLDAMRKTINDILHNRDTRWHSELTNQRRDQVTI